MAELKVEYRCANTTCAASITVEGEVEPQLRQRLRRSGWRPVLGADGVEWYCDRCRRDLQEILGG